MSKLIDIHIRPATPDDQNYIIATYINSLRSEYPEMLPDDYDMWIRNRLNLLFSTGAEIYIASPEEVDDIILSYLIGTPTAIHFIYTKKVYRGLDIATSLINHWSTANQQLKPYFITHMSDDCRDIIKDKPNIFRYIPLA